MTENRFSSSYTIHITPFHYSIFLTELNFYSIKKVERIKIKKKTSKVQHRSNLVMHGIISTQMATENEKECADPWRGGNCILLKITG